MDIDRLREGLTKCELVKEMIPCEACEGDGSVYFTFDWGGEEYSELHDCPVCKGEGEVVVKGSMVPNPKQVIKIGLATFQNKYIQIIIDIAELLQVQDITLVWQNTLKGISVFKIGESEILLMPCDPPEEEYIVDSIQIK